MIALLSAAILAPIPAAAAVQPPLDRPLRLLSEETRDDGRKVRRYRLDRRIVFVAEPSGYRASMTLQRAEAEGSDERRSAFLAANRPLIGHEVVVHLTPNGELLGVEDLDSTWTLWLDAMRGAAGSDADRSRSVTAVTAGLGRMPSGQRQALLAEPVLALFAGGSERSPASAQPAQVTVGSATLDGMSEAVLAGNRLVTRTRAEGVARETGVRMVVDSEREVDRDTGLVMRSRRSVERYAGDRVLRAEEINTLVFR